MGRGKVFIDMSYFDWKEPRSVTDARNPEEIKCTSCGGDLPWHSAKCETRVVTVTKTVTKTVEVEPEKPRFQVCDHPLCAQPASNRLGGTYEGHWNGHTVKTCPDHVIHFRESPMFKGTPGLAVGALI